MVTFETKISVNGKSRFQIIRFLNKLNKENYLSWHDEHLDFSWLVKNKKLKGSRLHISENISGWKIKNNWEVIEVEENTRILLRAERRVPLYFEIELNDADGGTVVVHHISLGFGGFLGRIINPLLSFFVRSTVIKSYRRHTVEEYRKLEEIC
jgi:hypothetical protein